MDGDAILTLYLALFENEDDLGPCLDLNVAFLKEKGDDYVLEGLLNFSFSTWSDEKYKLSTENHLVDSPKAKQYADLINYWLQECIRDHSVCSQYTKRYDVQPKHIISLLSRGTDAQSLECRLQITEENPWHGNYITLSHRWGQGTFIRLKSSNINEFKDPIPADLLPNTFRDTLLVTIALGIKYAWIDSLCIVQDSTEDWDAEAPNVYAIYSNGYLNIAAASDSPTSDFDKGLFPQRFIDLIQPCLIRPQFPALPLSHKDWTENTILVLISSDLKSRRVDQSVLYSMAWTLQERLMSPRVCDFCNDQIFWECCEMEACETYPRGLDALTHYISKSKSRASVLFQKEFQTSLKDAWMTLVEEYTKKQLTYPKDRLPALAGLAKLYSQSLNEVYLAGLWENDLIYQMLWRRNGWHNYNQDRHGVYIRRGQSWP